MSEPRQHHPFVGGSEHASALESVINPRGVFFVRVVEVSGISVTSSQTAS